MRYRWILFDLDNTIYDFDLASKEALEETFRSFDIAYTEENILTYKRINHQCWTDFENGQLDFVTLRNIRFDLFARQLDLAVDPVEMTDYYLGSLSKAHHMVEGAKDLLESLQPHVKMAVVTNGLKEVKRPQMTNSAIRSYFEAIIISEEVGIGKPHSAFFEHAFDAIQRPPKSEVIIIGDNLNSDIKGGRDFGITTCWFNPKRKSNESDVVPDTEIYRLEDFAKVLGIPD